MSLLGLTLLVVEDEPLIALSIEDVLVEGGFAVVAVDSGVEALRILEAGETPIAGLVTDIRCGNGPDGWQLARRGRELNPNLPVVYISGDSAHEHRSRGLPESIMVPKPFAATQIVTAVSMLLNALPPAAHDLAV